jgi:hypothetical protein
MPAKGYLKEIYSRIGKKIKLGLGRYWLFWILANIFGLFVFFLIKTDQVGIAE